MSENGDKNIKPDPKTFLSEDAKKMGSYYNFSVDETKFKEIKKHSRRQLIRFGITGIIFGFFS